MKDIYKLAVILVGEFRTWAKASKYLFNFFDQRADQVDYFFVTWNVSSQTGELTNIGPQDIIAPFDNHNKNLVSFQILEPIGRHRTTFYNQAYLAKVGNLLKKKHELANNFVYDQVVETRPDCYFRTTDTPWKLCKDFEFEADGYPRGWDSGMLGMTDVYIRTSSATNDILADRYYFRRNKDFSAIVEAAHWEFNNQHWTLSDFMLHRKLSSLDYSESKFNPPRLCADHRFFCCVRPNFPDDMDLDAENCLKLDKLFISYNKIENFFYGPRNNNEPLVDKNFD